MYHLKCFQDAYATTQEIILSDRAILQSLQIESSDLRLLEAQLQSSNERLEGDESPEFSFYSIIYLKRSNTLLTTASLPSFLCIYVILPLLTLQQSPA
jgi:hypothetical protein